ncbi:MAG: amidophosphoribosyltransferase [Flavobacteriaceae bacterium]|jgi:ComF family protein|nr:amidophosphoribosyltransferase [Flavobacteriaceae bacterium]|tara:strand:- start:19047 stop:19709 length:663 start_codon:yes stop_codon:yes gene_type:complete
MLNLLFPKVCGGCKTILLKREEVICTQCRHSLPIISHHNTKDGSMKQLFYGKFLVENATAIIKFQKRGITQELLHNLKYKGQQHISSFFGKWLGAELAIHKDYQNIEMVIPVPLHKQKLKKRGYNQVEGFGFEIAKALQVPYVDTILTKESKTDSQVFKQRFLRFQTEEIFKIKHPHLINDKHILLVDDIITTGATIEKCALQIFKSKHVKLSIATIAIA